MANDRWRWAFRRSGAQESRAGNRLPAAGTRQRRRWMVFGPGLFVALVAAMLFLWGERQEAPIAPGGSLASARPVRQLNISPVAPAVDLAFVLQQRSALHLSERQADRLSHLEQRFQQETTDTRLALDQASAEFSREMQERGGKGVLLSDLQERTSAVSGLSSQLAAARQVYWASAVRVLTGAQRAQAEALWTRQWERRPPKGATTVFPATRRAGG